ncbi:MAG: carboxyltransferase domain-containing protein [Jatrophihabitans sp.]
MKVASYGSEALLVELGNAEQAAALSAHLAAQLPPGATEVMPGLHTVLLRFEPSLTDAARLVHFLGELRLTELRHEEPQRPGPSHDQPRAAADVEAIRLQVDYTGADLAWVAARTGLTPDEVITAHQAAEYRVALIGMAPGFYFLAGGDARLGVPRRPTPRTDVPKGALGLAGDYTGIYPRRGPGGWQLIGRVLDDLWHPTEVPAALLAPGTLVRFEAV